MSSADGYFVRTAGRRDLPAIRALLVETWHDTYDAVYGATRVTQITDDWHSLRALEVRLDNPNSEFLVADNGTALGGTAFACAEDGGRTVMLRQLYVRPACQGQGIGTALLGEIEASFPEARDIRLEVEEANEGALRFYAMHGFSRIGETGNCGTDASGMPALILGKSL
ncbi:N-acetyltransferase [Nitratireductor sp. ZSWI3]|uniref:GNAT family N-acetyltransferase n=1 Tax=Nitratireductor sp. ZSWI3 TaxID=2966359 RepID=UPI0021502BB5|nr:GNAT family N-acetyltransferase [Nitratireductor sp. ZSWI3]MCR4266475.1 GNAT family N-acetyltransferase [Nitratireductor sp. ZSWI3]